MRAAESNPDPREKLTHGERLRDVIVRTRIEGLDLVVLVLSHGENDNGRLSPFAKTPDHLDAVEIGQSQVEN